jgi:outer membrane lipoprotein-sorting protein
MKKLIIFGLIAINATIYAFQTGESNALEIIRKSEAIFRSASSYSEMSLAIIRPDWKRTIEMKAWSKGTKYSLILITAPARDKGVAFLKRDKEIWNWQPSIDRTIKMPPSMMMQSWMGSDFTNDDLVKESSMVTDYTHSVIGEATVLGRKCWKIQLDPKEEAAVVWGKIITYIDQKDYLQLKSELYDEDGYLVNLYEGSDIVQMGGKTITSKLTITPVEEDGHHTVITYKKIEFDKQISDGFFTIQQMKRVR